MERSRVKKILKAVSILALVNLIYLNFLVPVTLSFKQILLIALEVVKISEKKGIDLVDISNEELDQLIILALDSVKQIFKDNGFRFLPDSLLPKKAYAAGEVIPYVARPGARVGPFFGGSRSTTLIVSAVDKVDKILKGKGLVIALLKIFVSNSMKIIYMSI